MGVWVHGGAWCVRGRGCERADPPGDGRADRMGPCDILGEQQREVDLALLFVPGQVVFFLVFLLVSFRLCLLGQQAATSS